MNGTTDVSAQGRVQGTFPGLACINEWNHRESRTGHHAVATLHCRKATSLSQRKM